MKGEISGVYSGVGQQTTINGIHIKVIGDPNSEIYSYVFEENVDEIVMQHVLHLCTEHNLTLVPTDNSHILKCPVSQCSTGVEFYINV